MLQVRFPRKLHPEEPWPTGSTFRDVSSEMWKSFSVRLGHRFYWFYHLLTDENSYSTCKASSTFKYRKQGYKTLLFMENLLYPRKEQHLPMITLCDNTMRGDLMNNRLSMSVRTEFFTMYYVLFIHLPSTMSTGLWRVMIL